MKTLNKVTGWQVCARCMMEMRKGIRESACALQINNEQSALFCRVHGENYTLNAAEAQEEWLHRDRTPGFEAFMSEKHPELSLLPWQREAVQKIMTAPRGLGVTFLIRLLAEWDQEDIEAQDSLRTVSQPPELPDADEPIPQGVGLPEINSAMLPR